MPSRRIAVVCPRFPDGKAIGGAETLLRSLATRLVARGWDVTFLSTCAVNHFTWANERAPGVQVIDNIRVEFFPVDPRNEAVFLRVQASISAGRDVSDAEEELWQTHSVNSTPLCRHLAENRDAYDRVIMGPYLFGLIMAAARTVPEKTVLVPCLHDEPFAYRRCVQALFRDVRGIMFNSEPERDLAVRLFGQLSPRADVVGMGLTPFSTDPESFRRNHAITQPYLIYSGRREALKGTPRLLDYVHTFRERTGCDIKLVLTGSGSVEPPPALAPHILDVGFVSEAEKHSAMAGALAFCHPSVNESFSIVLLESWLAGTPALVSAHSQVLRHHCAVSNGGLWFTNYPEFEEELTLLVRQPELARKLAAAGRQYVLTEYSWDRIDERLKLALET